MTTAWNFCIAIGSQQAPRSVIDVGANQSQMTRLLLLVCEREARILSFEPNPKCRPLEKRFHIALSDSKDTAVFYLPPKDAAAGSLCPPESEKSWRDKIEVEVQRFDALVTTGTVPWTELRKPILLKLDTEGNELQVLRGFGRYLAEIQYVLLEVQNGEERPGTRDAIETHKLMIESGFNRSRVLYACYDGPWAPTYLDTLYWRE